MVSEVLTDSPFTTFARSTLGGVVLVVAAVAALVAVVSWVSRSRHPDRRVAAAAAVCAPVLLVVLNVILGKLCVWQSTLYTLPPVTLVSTTVLFMAAVTVAMLSILQTLGQERVLWLDHERARQSSRAIHQSSASGRLYEAGHSRLSRGLK